ncbi:MAG: PqqD family protein [Ruminococcaceae bacterium]|nr:PqqD family protein [Oscillospiraceae bacterium]
MKLNKTFITHNSANEQLMISVGGSFNGMVRSNPTAARIIEILKKEVTREEIIDKMLDEYDAPRSIIEQDVDKIVASLREIGAIDE